MECLPVTGRGVHELNFSPQVKKRSQSSRFKVFSDGVGVRLGETMATLRFSNAVLKMKQGAWRVHRYLPKALFFLPMVTGVVGWSCSDCSSSSDLIFFDGTRFLRVVNSLSQAWVEQSAAECGFLPTNMTVTGDLETVGCLCHMDTMDIGGQSCDRLQLYGTDLTASIKTCVLNAFSSCDSGSVPLGITIGFASFLGCLGIGIVVMCVKSGFCRRGGEEDGYVEM